MAEGSDTFRYILVVVEGQYVSGVGRARKASASFEDQTQKTGKAVNRLRGTSGAGGSGLLGVSYILDDMAQFQFGAAQGFRAITNNIAPLLAGFGGGGMLAGLVVAFTAASTAFQLFGQDAADVAVALDDIATIDFGEQAIEKVVIPIGQMQDVINELKDDIVTAEEEIKSSSLATIQEINRAFVQGRLFEIWATGGFGAFWTVLFGTDEQRRKLVEDMEKTREEQEKLARRQELVSGAGGEADPTRTMFPSEADVEDVNKALEEGTKAWDKYEDDLKKRLDRIARMGRRALAGEVTETDFLAELEDTWEKRANAAADANEDLQDILNAEIGFMEGRKALRESMIEDQKAIDQATDDFVESEETLSDLGGKIAVTQFNIGDAFATGLADAALAVTVGGANLLGALGSVAIGMGRSLIAFGVGGLAIKSFIKNPVAAIAAGAGLVAVGLVLRARANQAQSQVAGLSGIQTGSGFSPAISGGGSPFFSPSAGPLPPSAPSGGFAGSGEIVGRVSGNELLLVMERSQNSNVNTGISFGR